MRKSKNAKLSIIKLHIRHPCQTFLTARITYYNPALIFIPYGVAMSLGIFQNNNEAKVTSICALTALTQVGGSGEKDVLLL